jgi:hypothetical protein
MLNRRHFLAVPAGASFPLVRMPRRFGETRQPAARRWSGRFNKPFSDGIVIFFIHFCFIL